MEELRDRQEGVQNHLSRGEKKCVLLKLNEKPAIEEPTEHKETANEITVPAFRPVIDFGISIPAFDSIFSTTPREYSLRDIAYNLSAHAMDYSSIRLLLPS